ncbi:MAG: hypothetical protein JNL73_14055 [Anaerolineales bacterium]|nr:hypothetical protein [Anaerolineales bacterium]
MTLPHASGIPRMMKEPGEKRVFLPEFIQHLANAGLNVFIEEGYGSRSGFTFDDYRQGNERVRRCARAVAFRQDVVLVLRSPFPEEFKLLPSGTCLISMLHFATRPQRVAQLAELGIHAISLDSIVNDNNLRLVENMKAVAWNGLDVAFSVLERRWPGLHKPDGSPIRVVVVGTGMVGKHAVEAATKHGNDERNNATIDAGRAGVVATAIGRNVICNERAMEALLRDADILVDAAQRRDPGRAIIPNAWLAWLPPQAVIADLAVDPYTPDSHPPIVRGIEGIPQGSLDQYVFEPDDPAWCASIPANVPTTHRRTVVSCYSWPGIHPAACMRHYAQQLEPLFEPLIAKGYDGLSLDGGYFERALCRATLRHWLDVGQTDFRPR